MDVELIRHDLIVALTRSYEQNPHQFVTLPKSTLDSVLAREAVAELRNEGFVEEQVRGVIRFTARGYSVYGKPSFAPPVNTRAFAAVVI